MLIDFTIENEILTSIQDKKINAKRDQHIKIRK